MPVSTVTHLNFRGEARAALEFYHSVFGGELAVATYGQMGAAADPSETDQVVFGQVSNDDGFRLMAYDVQAALPHDPGKNPFYVALAVDSADELAALWAGLADGATVLVPLGPAPWASSYGKLTDRFGTTWIAWTTT